MIELVEGEKYQIVGIPYIPMMVGCLLSNGQATGFIEYENTIVPVDLSLFGDGTVGSSVVFNGI